MINKTKNYKYNIFPKKHTIIRGVDTLLKKIGENRVKKSKSEPGIMYQKLS